MPASTRLLPATAPSFDGRILLVAPFGPRGIVETNLPVTEQSQGKIRMRCPLAGLAIGHDFLVLCADGSVELLQLMINYALNCGTLERNPNGHVKLLRKTWFFWACIPLF